MRVAAGDADAPWLVLGALIAPLVALLAPPRRAGARRTRAAIAAGAVAVAVVARRRFRCVAADAAALLGGAPWQGVALAAALALLVPLLPDDPPRSGAPALVLGAVALLLPLGAVALGVRQRAVDRVEPRRPAAGAHLLRSTSAWVARRRALRARGAGWPSSRASG